MEVSPAPTRRYARWERWEDRVLRDFDRRGGMTLRWIAGEQLGRSYYAVRLRRKRIQAGEIDPEAPASCARCGIELEDERRQGYCPDCAARNREELLQRRRDATREESRMARRKRLRWSHEEDARLLAAGPTRATAQELGRTVYACWSRHSRLQRALRTECA